MPQRRHNPGEILGPYTLIERINDKKWKCKCNICGSIVDVYESNARKQKMCRECRKKFNARSRIDLTGRKFTKLTAKRYVGHGKWECACDCGNIITTTTGHLLSGHTRSCGCLIADWARENLVKDLSGKTIGKITFKYRIPNYVSPKGQSLSQYRCVCDCGNKFDALACNIINGNTKSCGCLTASPWVKYIRDTLNKNNISNDTEYTINDLRSPNGGLLRFDFVLFNPDGSINRLIEFQGESHYYSPQRKTNFGRFAREVTDGMKKEYCKINNIILEEIKYNEDVPKALEEIIYRYIASQSRAKR